MKRLLIAGGESDSISAAFEVGLSLSRASNAEIHLLSVACPADGDSETDPGCDPHRQLRSWALLQPLRERLAKEGLRHKAGIIVGHPVAEIVRYAKEQRIDHIVIGLHWPILFEPGLFDSIACRIVADSPCTVTVVK